MSSRPSDRYPAKGRGSDRRCSVGIDAMVTGGLAPLRATKRKDGVAIVLVLAFLVLITALVLAFFTTVTTEQSSSSAYAQEANAKGLGDSAVQMVIGTIRQATSRGPTVAWASQPGMIRTYGTGTAASADPLAYYKLYSSSNMVVTGGLLSGYKPESDAADVGGNANWYAQTAYFTDLNEPVFTSSGTVYPIVDPLTSPPPSDPATSPVSGFAVKSAPLAATGNVNPVPMPVRWLYQLRDGTLTAPDDPVSGTTVATFTKAPAAKTPSATNPIVGRIAFWTDDETSKVNVNTAAGDLSPSSLSASSNATGSFWDMPRTDSSLDKSMVTTQALTNEYQRYPGHPATVSLNTVFKTLSRDDIGTIAPRIASGSLGSAGGTIQTAPAVSTSGGASGSINYPGLDKDRLYASIDELMFKVASGGTTRSDNPVVTPAITSTRKFFLTANSRAPEVTLFGTPRVGIWPISNFNDSSHRTAKDQLIAFCGTIGGATSNNIYYFTRQKSDSRMFDYDSIPRNAQLYTYLQTLTGKPIPGFGGPSNGFVGKYSGDRDQILTEIFDYIRTVNASDPVVPTPYTPKFLVTGSASQRVGNPGSGMVLPIKIGSTKGFGRVDTISEAVLCFCASDKYTSGPNNGKPSKMQAYLLLEHFNPAAGPAGYVPNYVLSAGMTPTGSTVPVPISFKVKIGPTDAEQTITFADNMVSNEKANALAYGRFFGGSGGPFPPMLNSGYSLKTPYPYLGDISYPPAYGINMALPATFSLKGFAFDVAITSTGGETIQTLHFSFPDATLPRVMVGDAIGYTAHAQRLITTPSVDMVLTQDVLRSLEPAGTPKGDYRLLAAREDVPASWFVTHKDYADQTKMMAHSLRYDDRDLLSVNGQTTAPFVGTDYTYTSQTGTNSLKPDFPTSLLTTGTVMSNGHAGDWDTGMGNMADGAYINKADEGVSGYGGGGATSSDYSYYGALQSNNGALFSPNREMPSAVMFGSLSTGVVAQKPWQTLLFQPEFDMTHPHPGKSVPSDHLLLDLFEMPVVEPYPISEPLSTAGRVNMNYRIAPFNYITRNTALRAALDPVWLMAIGTGDTTYKHSGNSQKYRYPLDADQTILSFEDRFNLQDPLDPTKKGLFVSASEICDVPLVPGGGAPGSPSKATMSTWWNNYQRTGDNVREMPYNHLYPLLTTRSNTYMVHFRVQTLRKALPASTPASDSRWQQWDETKDQVLGVYRGSSIIERYVDPGDMTLPDFTLPAYANYSLDRYPDGGSAYKFRVLGTKQFAPQ